MIPRRPPYGCAMDLFAHESFAELPRFKSLKAFNLFGPPAYTESTETVHEWEDEEAGEARSYRLRWLAETGEAFIEQEPSGAIVLIGVFETKVELLQGLLAGIAESRPEDPDRPAASGPSHWLPYWQFLGHNLERASRSHRRQPSTPRSAEQVLYG